jgi:hypothetical protein
MMKEDEYAEPQFSKKTAWLGLVSYIVVASMIAWVFA